jgi:hypothetical protein
VVTERDEIDHAADAAGRGPVVRDQAIEQVAAPTADDQSSGNQHEDRVSTTREKQERRDQEAGIK